MSNTLHMKTYFDDFLKNIRLSEEQKKALVDAHTELRITSMLMLALATYW